MENFDFTLPKKIDEALVRELASCRFTDRGENVIFLGPPGVGKTHLACALGRKAIDNGKKVKTYKLVQLIEEIKKNETNEVEKQRRFLMSLVNLEVLILDDVEYYNLTPAVNDFLYRLFQGRYEKKVPTIFTANESFTEWEKLFGTQVRAAKIIDRVLERCHEVVILGDSQRIKDKLNPQKSTKPKSNGNGLAAGLY